METLPYTIQILREDYQQLTACVKNTRQVGIKEKLHTRTLSEELKRAVLLERDKFPPDVIRLNSVVTIKDMEKGTEFSFRIVLPEFADMKQKKVSVLAPMGTALIGFKKGDCVTWEMPAGTKQIRVLAVQTE